jgi:hypothetical protein
MERSLNPGKVPEPDSDKLHAVNLKTYFKKNKDFLILRF